MLVFDSKTQQELLTDVATYLRQLAFDHKNGMARTKTETALNTARANALIAAAMDLEGARAAIQSFHVVITVKGGIAEVTETNGEVAVTIVDLDVPEECQHGPNEDCMNCVSCGKCREDLDDTDTCIPCGGVGAK